MDGWKQGNATPLEGRPLVFGEVLFDLFPGGEESLGGAPFNVAWHLKGFGLDPLLITRVGQDERGRRALQAMEGWGLDTRGVQVDPSHPTGAVRVTVREGQPAFHILPERAYGHIQEEGVRTALEGQRLSILCHGTLALRGPASRSALAWIREHLSVPVLVDLNLRAPWWEGRLVEEALAGARWAKVNQEELAQVVGRRLQARECSGAALSLCQRYGLELVVVTLGDQGALAATGQGRVVRAEAAPVSRLVDTVGAGDAFTAVVMVGLLEGWEPQVMLERANRFAAQICQVQGALTTDRALYKAQVDAWRHGGP